MRQPLSGSSENLVTGSLSGPGSDGGLSRGIRCRVCVHHTRTSMCAESVLPNRLGKNRRQDR